MTDSLRLFYPLAIANKKDGKEFVLSNEHIEDFYNKIQENGIEYFDDEHNSLNVDHGTCNYELIKINGNNVLLADLMIDNKTIIDKIKNGKYTGLSLRHKADGCSVCNSLSYNDIADLKCLQPWTIAFTNKPVNQEEFIIWD